MNERILPTKKDCFFAWGWGIFCLLILLLLFYLLPRIQVNSSVLSLLPKTSSIQHLRENTSFDQAHLSKLEAVFLQRLERQMIWMVAVPNENTDPAAWFYEQLVAFPELTVWGPVTTKEEQHFAEFFYHHRYHLLDPQTRSRLELNEQPDWVLSQLYSAFVGVTSQEIMHDPLLLMRSIQLAQQSNTSVMLTDGWLSTQSADGLRWYFLYGELKDSAFSIEKGRVLVKKFDQLKEQFTLKWQGGSVLSRGAVFYSDYAATQAQGDIKRLGSLAIVGILLLIYLTFLSFRPLLLCLISIVAGVVVGTAATLLFFGELHLITLVLSISVIGVSTDYAIYYLVERMAHGTRETPWESMRKMAMTQWLALVTTVGAYLVMLLAPFPGLRQLAIFASAGLMAAGMTVTLIYPYASHGLPTREIPGLSIIMPFLHAWTTKKWLRMGLPTIVMVFSIAGIMRLQVDDDIAQLQSLPSHILNEERQIASLSGQNFEQKWFTVYGQTPQKALERLEHFVPQLKKAKDTGWIGQYKLFPFSSMQRQQADWELIKRAFPSVIVNLQQAGLEIVEPIIEFEALMIKPWLDSPVSQGWRLLFASLDVQGASAILVPVTDVSNSEALQHLANESEGVLWSDRKRVYDTLFENYRVMLSGLLLLAVGILILIYTFRLGIKNGLIVALPSICSLLGALGLLGWMGVPLNLFGLLALVLVLGIGTNYTLFLNNPKNTPTVAMFATIVAFCTTLLSLGVLAMSQTQAISSFGLSLSGGIFVAFLLSPLALCNRATVRAKVN